MGNGPGLNANPSLSSGHVEVLDVNFEQHMSGPASMLLCITSISNTHTSLANFVLNIECLKLFSAPQQILFFKGDLFYNPHGRSLKSSTTILVYFFSL